MIAQIVDDLYDMSFLTEWEDLLLDHIPVYSTNVANPKSFPNRRMGSHRLLGVDIFARNGLNRVDVLHPKASKFFDAFEILENQVFRDSIYLHRMDVNLQFQYQEGTQHIDGVSHNDYTIMVMNNTKWKSEWGGQFQMLSTDGNVIEEHEYIPGRVIIFPGDVSHRGLAPIVPYVYRYTTAYRVVMDPDKVLSYVRTYAKD